MNLRTLAVAVVMFASSGFAKDPKAKAISEAKLEAASAEIGSINKETPERKAACDEFQRRFVSPEMFEAVKGQAQKDHAARMTQADSENPFMPKRLNFEKPGLMERASFMAGLATWSKEQGGKAEELLRAGSLYCLNKVSDAALTKP